MMNTERKELKRQKKNQIIDLEELEKSPENESNGGGETENEALEDILVDIIASPFQIWNLRNPKVDPLSDEEKQVIKKPLARVVKKYNLDSYVSDEIWLGVVLGGVLLKRVEQARKKNEPNPDDHR